MLSIILPTFNEQDNINLFYKKLILEIKKIKLSSFEIIFVDDGSQDNTKEKIKAICKKNKKVKLISFTKNFGHQAAIYSGLKKSKGHAAIVMDADFQHPIEIIRKFYSIWKKDKIKVVHGVKKKNNSSLIRNFLSIVGYKIINLLSPNKLDQGGSDFYLLDRKVITEILKLNEPRLMFRMLISMLGFKKKIVFFDARKRFRGISGYSIKKLFNILRFSVITSSNLPLRFITLTGIIIFLFSVCLIVFEILSYFLVGNRPPGFPTLLILISFFGGLNLLCLGIIGEYTSHIVHDKLSNLSFIEEENINFDD